MTSTVRPSVVAECYWSGVSEDDLRALDRRIGAALGDRGDVRHLGSLLIVDDDVVLCLFDGTPGAVRDVAERAGVPFGRLLRTRSPEGDPT